MPRKSSFRYLDLCNDVNNSSEMFQPYCNPDFFAEKYTFSRQFQIVVKGETLKYCYIIRHIFIYLIIYFMSIPSTDMEYTFT